MMEPFIQEMLCSIIIGASSCQFLDGFRFRWLKIKENLKTRNRPRRTQSICPAFYLRPSNTNNHGLSSESLWKGPPSADGRLRSWRPGISFGPMFIHQLMEEDP